MTLQQLRYAIAVCDCKSINKAAKEFYLSQPALSGAIHEIEEEIGTGIFSRTNRGVSPTPAGSEFLSYARALVEQYALLENRFVKKQNREKFGVSCQHYSFAVSAFIALVKSVGMEKYAFQISETKTADVISDVKNFRSEVGVLFMDSFNEPVMRKIFHENYLQFEELFICHAYVYLSVKHPLAKKKKITFDELKGYPNLSFDQGNRDSFYYAEEILSTLDYDQTIKANDRATMCNLMTGLNGYTLCSGIICEEEKGGAFTAIPFDDKEVMRIGYVHREDTRLSPLAERYIALLKDFESQAK